VGPSVRAELLDEVVLDVMVDLSVAIAALAGGEEAELQAYVRRAATTLPILVNLTITLISSSGDAPRTTLSRMGDATDRIAALITAAGYERDEPVLVAVLRRDEAPWFVAQGLTRAGEPLSGTTLVYTASLSKQLVAGCAALLVQGGGLDMDSALSRWLPELPGWADTVRLRHLVYHTSALPDDQFDAAMAEAGGIDHTSQRVLDALSRVPVLERQPGTAYAYSGPGYVCLAVVVARAAGQPLPDFARRHLFNPLAMTGTCFWPGPAPAPPGAAPLAPPRPAPLSLGDGGAWSTAADLLRWSHALNTDQLGISGLVQTPGRLDDGTVLDYAWGMGVRSHAGRTVYRHGGGWPSLRVLLARVPDLDLSLVTIALADDTERRVPLANSLLDLLAGSALSVEPTSRSES
jgi:CubicO group peptidase (beta-lactamase class C family)